MEETPIKYEILLLVPKWCRDHIESFPLEERFGDAIREVSAASFPQKGEILELDTVGPLVGDWRVKQIIRYANTQGATGNVHALCKLRRNNGPYQTPERLVEFFKTLPGQGWRFEY